MKNKTNLFIFLLSCFTLVSFLLLTGCGVNRIHNLFTKPSLSADANNQASSSEQDKDGNYQFPEVNSESQTNNKNNSDKDLNNVSTSHSNIRDQYAENNNIDEDSTSNNYFDHKNQEGQDLHKDNLNHANTPNTIKTNSDGVLDPRTEQDDYNTDGTGDKNNNVGDQEIEALPVAQVIRHSLNQEIKQVALTFDDGVDDHFTPQVLDILKEYNVKATFFIIGAESNKNKEILKKISDEGHAIGGHSWNHSNFTKISKSRAKEELQKTDELIQEVTGKSYKLFRLPFGAYNQKVLNMVADEGYHNIYWSIDTRDWSGKSPKEILNSVKRNLKPGDIILLHSNGSKKHIPNSIKALPSIIEYIEGQGYEIVTIPELLNNTP